MRPPGSLSRTSSRVNHVANDDEECTRPVEHAETENRLFL